MSEHDDVLVDILTGDLALDSKLAQDYLSDHPEAEALIAELREVQGLLDAEGAEVREALAWKGEISAPGEAGPPEPAALRPVQTPRGSRHLPWIGALTVAAALVLLFQLVGGRAEDPGPHPGTGIMLGDGGSLDILSPVGPGQGTYVFAFESDRDRMLTAEAHVWPRGADRHSPSIAILHFDGMTWDLTPEKEAGLPDEIEWQLYPKDELGAPLAPSPVLQASR
mgnify:CR=1 FL=1